MIEPIDIDELRWKLDEALDDGFPFARDWAERNGPQLLDALAALRLAAEPYRAEHDWARRFGGAFQKRDEILADACRLVKLPEGAGK